MKHPAHVRIRFAACAAVLATVFSTVVLADSVRVGSTFFPKPSDGKARYFPHVAYDAANNAYLVVWGLQDVGARYVSASGALLGSPVVVSTTTAGPVRVACGTAINACLVTWLQEPSSVIGRLVRYSGGNVTFLTAPFSVNSNGVHKLTSAPPAVAYSSASNEFLVAWTEVSSSVNVKAQRVSSSGAKLGDEISVAVSSLWEGFPAATYNSAQNEFLVVHQYETTTGVNALKAVRVQAGSGSVLGGNTIASSVFDQYPEVAYNSQLNQYLTVTWGFSSGNNWMLRGRLNSGTAAAIGSTSLALAAAGGGPGIGLAYNPTTNRYFAVYQSQTNDEVWGVEIRADGVPRTQIQVTSSGTALAVQPRVASTGSAGRWLAIASENYRRIMGQLVDHTADASSPPPTSSPPPSSGGCTTVQPGPDWTCVNGNWLPSSLTGGSGGSTGGSTGGCSSPSPGTGWTCVNGNWLPPSTGGSSGGSTSGCTTVKPASDWVCVNGNWLPPSMAPSGGSSGGSGSTCTTASPGTGWTCVNGNWLPPSTTSTSSCTTVRPGADWTCVNGNWLPPGY